MKKICLSVAFCLLAASVFCQFENIWKRKPWEELKYSNRHKLILRPADKISEPQQEASVNQQMPIVILELKLKAAGTLNNGNQLLIAEPYHMPCIAPPDNYISAMPVLGKTKNPKAEEIEK